MSRPTLNTFAANQSAPSAAPIDSTTVTHTCQAGGGAVDVILISIANVFIGGMKLITVANVEDGSRAIGAARSHGHMMVIVIGIISDCALRFSFPAPPIPAINEPSITYVTMKNTAK